MIFEISESSRLHLLSIAPKAWRCIEKNLKKEIEIPPLLFRTSELQVSTFYSISLLSIQSRSTTNNPEFIGSQSTISSKEMVVPAKSSNPFNPRTSKASDATYHEPVPPNLASHGQKFGNKVRIPTYKAMQNGPDPKRSLELLMRIASLVKPIMVKHNFCESPAAVRGRQWMRAR